MLPSAVLASLSTARHFRQKTKSVKETQKIDHLKALLHRQLKAGIMQVMGMFQAPDQLGKCRLLERVKAVDLPKVLDGLLASLDNVIVRHITVGQ
jgi:hypothetical protein